MKYLRKDAVLCYADECRAYFTTQELKDQWGDNWNDAPYEHNAGLPYKYQPEVDKGKSWEILIIYWNGPFLLPNDGCVNSPFSVQEINACAVAWLRIESGFKPFTVIHAGINMIGFTNSIHKCGGEVYVPLSGWLHPVSENDELS